MTTTPGLPVELGHQTEPFDAAKFPRDGVIGEIKPHNRAASLPESRSCDAVAASPSARPSSSPIGRCRASPPRYEVLAADPTQLAGVIRGRRAEDRHLVLARGSSESSRAALPIPLWQCSSSLGNLLERQIRQRYAARVGATLRPKSSASQTGADIEHELLEMAEFLRELAAELRPRRRPTGVQV